MVPVAIRVGGVGVVLAVFLALAEGIRTVDLFTVAVVAGVTTLIAFSVRPFILSEVGVVTWVTLGIPVFSVSFLVLFGLAQVFPGFSVEAYWQLPTAAFIIAFIHVIAESFTHHEGHHH